MTRLPGRGDQRDWRAWAGLRDTVLHSVGESYCWRTRGSGVLWLTMKQNPKRKPPNRLKVRHTVYLEPELSKQLVARSALTGALPTEIVRRALRDYLKRVK